MSTIGYFNIDDHEFHRNQEASPICIGNSPKKAEFHVVGADDRWIYEGELRESKHGHPKGVFLDRLAAYPTGSGKLDNGADRINRAGYRQVLEAARAMGHFFSEMGYTYLVLTNIEQTARAHRKARYYLVFDIAQVKVELIAGGFGPGPWQ